MVLVQKLQLMESQQAVLAQELDYYRGDWAKRSLVKVENERLKKHIVARQREVTEMRTKWHQMQKQLQKRAADLEQELMDKYKDRMTGHLKVLDLELNKLQAIVINS